MMRVDFAFHMFGHPYAFGDGTSPVYVVGMLFEKSFVKSLPNFSGPNQGGTSFKLYPLNFDLPPSAWPQFVRYLDEYDVQVPLDYNRTPGAEDVPASTGPFPSASSSAGKWLNPVTGQEWPNAVDLSQVNPATGRTYRADSDWRPADGTPLHQLTQGAVIAYRRGYPDFSNYATYTATLNPMKGDEKKTAVGDFGRANTEFGASTDFAPSLAQGMTVNQWMQSSTNYTKPSTLIVPDVSTSSGASRPNWVWHHNQDMKRMELVPSVLNTPTFGGIHHTGGAAWAEDARW